VAVATPLGITFRDAETMAVHRTLEAESEIAYVAFSPDWQIVALASANQIRLRRLSDGSMLRILQGQAGSEGPLAFTPDGSLLVSMAFPPGDEVYTGAVELWRVTDGTLVKTWDSGGSRLAVSPDGTLLATWYAQAGARLWSIPDGELVHSLEVYESGVWVAFSPDGETLACVGMDGVIHLWRVADWTQMQEMGSGVQEVLYSPDGTLLVSLAYDGTIEVWSVAEGRALHAFGSGSGYSGTPLAFSPDGETLASAVQGVQFWQVADGSLLRTLEGYNPGIYSLAVSPDGMTVALQSREPLAADSTVLLWRPFEGSARPLEHTGDALSLAWSPDGTMLGLGLWDGLLRLVRVADGQVVDIMGQHSAQVQNVAFSQDGRLVASCALEDVRLWQVSDGSLLRIWEIPGGGWIVGVTFSPDGTLVAAQRSSDGAVQLWRVADGALVRTFSGDWGLYFGGLAFSPDGAVLALATGSQVLVWTVADGSLLRTLELPVEDETDIAFTSISFSPDGSLLAAVAHGELQLWQVADGRLLQTLARRTGQVYSVAFSPDGRFIATGSQDGTATLWGIRAASR
jgi:WD40 repeat protein